MKTIRQPFFIALALSVFPFLSFSQGTNTLNGYKYVYIPQLYYNTTSVEATKTVTDGYGNIRYQKTEETPSKIEDEYHVVEHLRQLFLNKGFAVLINTSELKDDPCLMLTCTVKHDWSTIGLKRTSNIALTISNCNNEIIFNTNKSAVWALLGNAQDASIAATDLAFQDIADMTYKFDASLKTKNIQIPEVEKTTETEQTIKTYLSSNTVPHDSIEGIYISYQASTYYKFGVIKSGDVFKAIIIESDAINWKQGEVKALFEQSPVKGLYAVKWYMADKSIQQTFAHFKDKVFISVDIKTGQQEFIKMFPLPKSSK
jgi:hypothetical protein